MDPAEPAGTAGKVTSNPLAVQGMPGESFSFTIAMDANDEIADGSAPTAALAKVSGIYSRLAALEMLLYPTGAPSTLVGTVSAAVTASITGEATTRSAWFPSPSCRSPCSSGGRDGSCPSG